MKPIHKFNNGRGATLCHKCSVIISTGLTEELYCSPCKQKLMDEIKLIAEFMGGVYNDSPNRQSTFDIPKDSIWLPVHNMVRLSKLRYNTSWDWLMPVIGKISNECEEPEELDGLKYALLCNDIDTAFKFVADYIQK